MTLDEIKDYVKDYFIQKGYRTFEDGIVDSEQLDIVAIRYQYFGERIFDIYKYNLHNCAFRSHKWFLLEMVNPKMAKQTTDEHVALEGVLDDIDTKLWRTVYQYYDHIGHDKFKIINSWLDEHRDTLLPYDYDIV